jgi:hypothetical protein
MLCATLRVRQFFRCLRVCTHTSSSLYCCVLMCLLPCAGNLKTTCEQNSGTSFSHVCLPVCAVQVHADLHSVAWLALYRCQNYPPIYVPITNSYVACLLCLTTDTKIMNHAIESIMMAVGNGAAPTSRSWAVKIVYIAWAVFCVIMLAAYTVSEHGVLVLCGVLIVELLSFKRHVQCVMTGHCDAHSVLLCQGAACCGYGCSYACRW